MKEISRTKLMEKLIQSNIEAQKAIEKMYRSMIPIIVILVKKNLPWYDKYGRLI